MDWGKQERMEAESRDMSRGAGEVWLSRKQCSVLEKRRRKLRRQGCVGPRWTEPGKLSSVCKGHVGAPHLGLSLSRKGGGSLVPFPLQR